MSNSYLQKVITNVSLIFALTNTACAALEPPDHQPGPPKDNDRPAEILPQTEQSPIEGDSGWIPVLPKKVVTAKPANENNIAGEKTPPKSEKAPPELAELSKTVLALQGIVRDLEAAGKNDSAQDQKILEQLAALLNRPPAAPGMTQDDLNTLRLGMETMIRDLGKDRNLSTTDKEAIKKIIDDAIGISPKDREAREKDEVPLWAWASIQKFLNGPMVAALNFMLIAGNLWGLYMTQRGLRLTELADVSAKRDRRREKKKAMIGRKREERKAVQALAHQANLMQNLGGLAKRNDEFFERTARGAYENQHKVWRTNAMIQSNSTVQLLSNKPVRDSSEELGELSEQLPYISRQIKNAKKQVILSMPFHLFGVMGNPKGWNKFHQTLREEFKNAAEDGKELIVLIYDDDHRKALARRRYSRAIDALRLLQYPWQNEDLLMTFEDNQPEQKKLREAIEEFNRDLTYEKRTQISRLCFEQRGKEVIGDGDKNYNKERIIDAYHAQGKKRSWQEIGDDLFLQTLDGENRDLFQKARNMRRALGDALAAQELKYFNKKDIQDNWKNVTLIEAKYNAKLNDRMAICFDGQEVIKISSDMERLQSTKNTVESLLGPKNLRRYRKTLSDDLKKAGMDKSTREQILKRLDEATEVPRPA